MRAKRYLLTKTAAGLLLLTSACLLAGCGYKGPLTLPEQAAHHTTTYT